jgi:hypothetical protein
MELMLSEAIGKDNILRIESNYTPNYVCGESLQVIKHNYYHNCEATKATLHCWNKLNKTRQEQGKANLPQELVLDILNKAGYIDSFNNSTAVLGSLKLKFK